MFFLDTFFKGLKPRFDDDIVDRMNYYYTPMVLIVFALTLSAKQYVGKPIQCWVPAQFTGAWEQYSENYCFVQNTYWLPLNQHIPQDYGERDRREIGYYQWVPFILALQALLFYMPCLVWRLLNWQSGITVKGIINMSMDTKNMDKDTREKNVQVVSRHIQDSLNIQRDLEKSGRFCGILFYGKHYGSFVTGLYLFVKFLYILNVICQFFILNSFLGPQYTFWGVEILRDLAYGREWQESGHFPRVTMCDFDVRVLGNLHRWTIQCVLMINMFNEKIYLFLWFWFFIVAVATCMSFIYWVVVSVMKPQQRQFIHRYLRVSESLQDSPGEQKALSSFVHQNLRPDGCFLLRMIATNVGDLLVNDLVDNMWREFMNKRAQVPHGLGPQDDSKKALLDDVDSPPETDSERSPLKSNQSSPSP